MSGKFIWLCLGFLVEVSATKALEALPADANAGRYIKMLAGKRVALVVNQTSVYKDSLLPERLLARGINVQKLFVPEHGFRGNADAGEHIDNAIDSVTGLPVISLYGSKKGPSEDDLKDVDVLVFDLQDVGVRFYTYISTLEFCLIACNRSHVSVVILDRPNPNGFYVAGPVLDTVFRSFVGRQPIPIVHGLTVGEYAKMLIGEKWIPDADRLQLTVVKCQNYTHSTRYRLSVPPSPNLRDMSAIYAYPSLCLFEGTGISVGRGTDKPFRQYGAPQLRGAYTYYFVPVPGTGAKRPQYQYDTCFGELVAPDEQQILNSTHGQLNIEWLAKAYNASPDKDHFFTGFFQKLVGNNVLQEQIKSGVSTVDITKTWQPELGRYKQMRKKYLLYADF